MLHSHITALTQQLLQIVEAWINMETYDFKILVNLLHAHHVAALFDILRCAFHPYTKVLKIFLLLSSFVCMLPVLPWR